MRQAPDESALFAVALMKLALEVKRVPSPGLESSVQAVVSAMRLDEARFRAFLGAHLAELGAVAPARGSARRRRTPRG